MESQLLVSLTEKYGSPLYVYDAEKMESQYNRITAAFSSVKNLKLNYAVKANSNISI
ncbi:MAG: diaminopimelate decarboxylase, partial [Lutibacter sp.]|nr:diaminopimelate decarboxylase [Lutibacter sp.]